MGLTPELTARRLFEIESAGQSGSTLWGLKEYESELASPESRFFGWQDQDILRGFVLYRVLDPEAWIMHLAVERKGAGDGSRLFEAFLAAVTAQRVESVGLEVGERNSAARRLYDRFGFAVIGKRKNYYRNGDNALVMRRSLIG